MKIGQTSLVVFLSKLLGSALGFLATLYFARELGAEILGIYALILTVVGWLALAGKFGVGKATTKRISEEIEQDEFFSAGGFVVAVLAVVISFLVLLIQPVLESYVSEFDSHVDVSVVWFVIAILFVHLFYHFILHTLRGQRMVHLAGFLDPVKIVCQSLTQVALVLLGYGLLGMLVGYVVGGIIIGTIGIVWITVGPTLPEKKHFSSLFDYAKYSWLGGLKSKAFNEVDILILGIFVPSALVGVYSVAWSISKFLDLFGTAVRETMFPEISRSSAQESKQAAAEMIEDSLAYTGLIAIPGLIGGLLLDDRLLRLYGEEFIDGTTVLGLLILAILFYSYQKQLVNGLNGLGRPDIAFRINAVFAILNIILNFLLIWMYDIEGAAIATAFSVFVSLVHAYYTLSQLITFDIPYSALSRQWGAAFLMGGVVLGIREIVEITEAITHNAIIVIGLVFLGAGTYFLTLLAISSDFRNAIERNIPFRILNF